MRSRVCRASVATSTPCSRRPALDDSYPYDDPRHYVTPDPDRLTHLVLVDGRLVDVWSEPVAGTRWQEHAERFDRQLERLARGESTLAAGALASDLADQRLAIASEKLALTSGIELPRLEPAFGAGMGAALGPDEEVEIVEAEALRNGLFHVLLWAAGFLVLCIAVAIAAVAGL